MGGFFERLFGISGSESKRAENTFLVEDVEAGVILAMISELNSDKPNKTLLGQIKNNAVFKANYDYLGDIVYELLMPTTLSVTFEESVNLIYGLSEFVAINAEKYGIRKQELPNHNYTHIQIVIPKGSGYSKIPQQLNIILENIVTDQNI